MTVYRPTALPNKKPVYIGDPNATMTICYTKRRRHLQSDINVRIDPADEKGGPTKVRGYCRHCKENPYIPKAETASP